MSSIKGGEYYEEISNCQLFNKESAPFCLLFTLLIQGIYSLTQQTDKSKRQIIIKRILRYNIHHNRHSAGRNDSTSSRLHGYGHYQQERNYSTFVPRVKSYVVIDRYYTHRRIFFFFHKYLRKLF
jgi:hypothetical protein